MQLIRKKARISQEVFDLRLKASDLIVLVTYINYE